jgi:hypothetical protein
MNKKSCFIALLAALTAAPVFADGQSAVNNFYANLARGGQRLDVKISDTTVTPTLVRGMYRMETIQGKFLGYTNEAGTLLGSGSYFEGLPPGARQFRKLTTEERGYLRREAVSNIDKSRLIKARYGNGQRSVFLFSAIDCPASKHGEELLRKNGNQYNATFYIIPTSLNNGVPQGQKVAKLWCAANSGDAWKKYWVSGTIPAAGQCPFSDYKIAKEAQEDLRAILNGLGLAVKGYPSYIREDSIKISLSTVTTAPEFPQPDANWLAGGSSATDFHKQRVIASKASADNTTQQARQTGGTKTINLGDAVQEIFKGLGSMK